MCCHRLLSCPSFQALFFPVGIDGHIWWVALPLLWGDVCPARAWRATFLLTIPTSAPDLPSHGEAPQVDHVGLHTFPTKHVA